MFVFKCLFVAGALSIAVGARPKSNPEFEKIVLEKLEAAPADWTEDLSEMVDRDATSITLKIHLMNKNMDKFHEHAMNVSTNGSRRNPGLMLRSHADRHTRPHSVWSAHVPRRNSHHDCSRPRVGRSRYEMASE
jgi:hypothetical protein